MDLGRTEATEGAHPRHRTLGPSSCLGARTACLQRPLGTEALCPLVETFTSHGQGAEDKETNVNLGVSREEQSLRALGTGFGLRTPETRGWEGQGQGRVLMPGLPEPQVEVSLTASLGIRGKEGRWGK